MHQFKAKNSEIKDYTLRVGNISKDSTINNMKKNRIMGGVVKFDFNPIDINNILDINKYLMKKT